MKRYLLLVLTTLPVFAAFGCKKTVPTIEAGTDVDAAVAAVVVEDAGPTAELDAGPATTLTPAKTAVVPAKSAAPATPYAGTYSCNGASVVQSGSTVTSRFKPGETQNYSSFTCTAAGDSCDGTTTIYVQGKLSGTKKANFKRAANGDLTYKADGEAPQLCHKAK